MAHKRKQPTSNVKAGKPALGIHDSLVVRASDRAFAEEVMVRTYQKFFRFPPLVHIVY